MKKNVCQCPLQFVLCNASRPSRAALPASGSVAVPSVLLYSTEQCRDLTWWSPATAWLLPPPLCGRWDSDGEMRSLGQSEEEFSHSGWIWSSFCSVWCSVALFCMSRREREGKKKERKRKQLIWLNKEKRMQAPPSLLFIWTLWIPVKELVAEAQIEFNFILALTDWD